MNLDGYTITTNAGEIIQYDPEHFPHNLVLRGLTHQNSYGINARLTITFKKKANASFFSFFVGLKKGYVRAITLNSNDITSALTASMRDYGFLGGIPLYVELFDSENQTLLIDVYITENVLPPDFIFYFYGLAWENPASIINGTAPVLNFDTFSLPDSVFAEEEPYVSPTRARHTWLRTAKNVTPLLPDAVQFPAPREFPSLLTDVTVNSPTAWYIRSKGGYYAGYRSAGYDQKGLYDLTLHVPYKGISITLFFGGAIRALTGPPSGVLFIRKINGKECGAFFDEVPVGAFQFTAGVIPAELLTEEVNSIEISYLYIPASSSYYPVIYFYGATLGTPPVTPPALTNSGLDNFVLPAFDPIIIPPVTGYSELYCELRSDSMMDYGNTRITVSPYFPTESGAALPYPPVEIYNENQHWLPRLRKKFITENITSAGMSDSVSVMIHKQPFLDDDDEVSTNISKYSEVIAEFMTSITAQERTAEHELDDMYHAIFVMPDTYAAITTHTVTEDGSERFNYALL